MTGRHIIKPERVPAAEVLQPVLDQMPAPAASRQAAALEAELAAAFGVRHAVAVSSGTAALHTALVACGVEPGDEVLVPAMTVMMTVAAIVHAGARPVFVDAAPAGDPIDLDDLAAKITSKSRAVMPVHLGGRCGDMKRLTELATTSGLLLIEDACQAQGSRYLDRPAGTIGDVGCFSLKDGKVLACGEGGYLLTNNPTIATRAAGFRSHWQTAAAGIPAGTRLGHNYRLAEPLAAIARHHLARFDAALSLRRHQADYLQQHLSDAPGIQPLPPGPDEEPNGYAALWRISLPEPRSFSMHLADRGVINSVGTFGLRAAHQHPACQHLNPAPCPNAANAIDTLLAVPLCATDTDHLLAKTAGTIIREARTWAAC